VSALCLGKVTSVRGRRSCDGQITVEGPFYDKNNSVLAITGGTGAYDRAQGQMLLSSRKGGSEFNFEFKLAQ